MINDDELKVGKDDRILPIQSNKRIEEVDCETSSFMNEDVGFGYKLDGIGSFGFSRIESKPSHEIYRLPGKQ